MIDKIFSYLSEWAPLVALAACLWCALYGSIELVLAYGFAAVVLELHDMMYSLYDMLINWSKDFEDEFGGPN